MYCECGCGEITSLAERSDKRRGCIKGKPKRFIRGHNNVNKRGIKHKYAPRIKVRHNIDTVTGCWVWLLSVDSKGYGQVRIKGKTCRAHRVMYESLKGPIPEDLELDHLCRNRRCVNPDHLEPVIGKINTRRGANAKITQTDADAIRAIPRAKNIRQHIKDKYGLSDGAITSIRSGKSWQ